MGLPKGIGGWLAFFIVTLILSILINTVLGIHVVASTYSDYEFEDYGLLLVLFEIILYSSLVGFCIYVLVLLFRLSPGAIFAAKLYLIAFFCLSFFFTLIGLFVGESLFSSLYSLLKSFIYSFVWFSYLSVSRRVRNTYRSQKRLVREWIIFAVVLSTPLLLIFAGVMIASDDSSGAVEKGFIEFDIPKGLEFNREYYKGVPVYYFEKPGTLLVLLTVEHDGSAREFMDDSFDDLLLKYFEGAEYGLVSDSKGRTSEGYGYVERVTAVEEGDMYLFGVRVFEMQGYVAVLAFSSWLEDSEDTNRIVDSLSDSLVLEDW